MERVKLKTPQLSRAAFDRRADQFLAKIQQELLPEHASEFVAINMETGEYVLGQTPHEAFAKFRTRWPDNFMFRCRVDGGPVVKFRGK